MSVSTAHVNANLTMQQIAKNAELLNATGPSDPHPYPPKATQAPPPRLRKDGVRYTPHDKQFQHGDNTRQLKTPKITPDGRTLAAVCRDYTYDALQMLVAVVQGEEYELKDRLRAAETLLDRGWGKAVSVVAMDVTSSRDIKELSRDELLALAQGGDARTPITYEGETVQEAVYTNASEEQPSESAS
jgi:hypothetical protein